ncbi:NfeD family protein [Salimicrobium halophilum]|uniref:NfeD-like C-terminal, partner-binding n=1 Tax=Salimicrobium halophilum TaxID=86666 RepID=A0A1G8PTA7_9BACI|nr:NfeD family protein [Salimicrobium halophilum]SDI95100.1 NfeD-like C-terminal, partner-binding [Salimicrobium halophilum]
MLAYDWIAFFVTFFGTMFLIGELLVRMKGVFALLGVGFITVYFYSYLEPDMFFLMGAMYVLGLTLLIVDGKFVNDGTLGTIGAVIMVLSVSLSAPSWGAGLYSASGVVLGGFSSLVFLKVFPKRQVWGKVALKDQLSSEMGYNSMNETYKSLIGREGTAVTDMRPTGTIQVDGEEYSATTNGKWLEKGDAVKVEHADGTRILVKKMGA